MAKVSRKIDNATYHFQRECAISRVSGIYSESLRGHNRTQERSFIFRVND